MKHFTKSMLCLLLVLLLAAAALTGCAQKQPADTEAPKTEAQGQTPSEQPIRETVTAIGEGEKIFHLKVTFADGEVALFDVHTDAETVGAALYNLQLISGDNGLYDTVCGRTLSWENDQMYWAFYIGEEFAMTGLDETVITPDASYALVATKG